MANSDRAYHESRAAQQRRMAAACDDTSVAASHVALAELHEARAQADGRADGRGRTMLRVVIPS